MTRLRYCDTVSAASSSGSIAKYIFRVNDCFDPDVTGTGHQPLYRDTFAGIYDFYSVISARVRVTFTNTANVPAHCGIVFDDDTTSSTTASTLMEQNTGVHHLLPAQSGSLSSHTFHLNWNAAKMLGINPLKDQAYKALWGVSPTLAGAMACWIQPADFATTATYFINVEIDQVVYCSDLQTPTGS
jgi:hypothetical protein